MLTDKQKIEILKKALIGVIGEDRIESLYAMKDMLVTAHTFSSNRNTAVTIEAINALILVREDEESGNV